MTAEFFNKKFFKTAFIVFLIALPIGAFLFILFKYAVNLPFRDDWTGILLFLNSYLDAHGIIDKFNLIVENQYDHRIAWTRIVSLLVFKVFGVIDFRVIIFIGALSVFIILLCFWFAASDKSKNIEERLLLFLPVVFFLVQPMYSEILFQADGSVSGFYPIAFGVLALLILDKKSSNSWAGLGLAFIAGTLGFFSHREGLAFLLAGTALLLFKKEWRNAVVWSVSVFLIFLFFQNYRVNLNSLYSFPFDFKRLIGSAVYFLAFIGNNFGLNRESGYMNSLPGFLKYIVSLLPFFVGICISIYIIFLAVKRYDKQNQFISSILVAALIITVGASLSRDAQKDALVSRYRLATVLYILSVYISAIDLIIDRKIKMQAVKVFIIISMLFSAGAYALKIKPIREHKIILVQSFKTYQETGKGLISIAWNPEDPEPILKESMRKKVWKIPE